MQSVKKHKTFSVLVEFSRICKYCSGNFFQNQRLVYIVPIILDGNYKEFVMITIVKWIVTVLFASFTWLFTVYAVEYFRPYKRVEVRIKR